MMRKLYFYWFICLFISFNMLLSAKDVQFNKDDVVCFIGNSITHGGMYHGFLYIYMATHFPNTPLDFYNCGVSGDTSDGMLRRFDEDVLAHKPTHAFLMTGMNDMWSHLYGMETPDAKILAERKRSFEVYHANTEQLVKKMLENKVQPILITPTIYDETAKIGGGNSIGKNAALSQCAVYIRHLADKYDVPVIDFNKMMNALNTEGQKTDSTFTIVGPDRVHPKDPGHWTMAFEIIKTLFPEQLAVSSIVMNAKKGEVVRAENADVEWVDANTFRVLEKSLPFPFRKSLQPTMNRMSVPKDFNKELFALTQLHKGSYQLRIDQMLVGTFTQKQLAKGIDLSQYETPQMLQAREIDAIYMKYHKVQEQLRDLYLIEFKNLAEYTGDGSLEDIDKYLKAKVEKQRGKSWYPYMVKTTTGYIENIHKKTDFVQELERLRTQIYTWNKPQRHTYILTKVN